MRKGFMAVGLLTALLFAGCAVGKQGNLPPRQENAEGETAAHSMAAQNMATQNIATQNIALQSEAPLIVTFLDVGQGNAIVVEQDGAYMLIDGGDREYSSYVVSYLQSRGAEKLDYVIASHYDADHLNGVVGVLHAFSSDMVLAPDYETDTKIYASFYDIVEEKDLELVYPAIGEVYSFGDAEFTVVCPDGYDDTDENENSIGIRLVYGDTSFLICGDAGEQSEKRMLERGLMLQSDVYLASHHGSAGSSGFSFLERVEPKAVVISVGADNTYGHPAQEVLSDIDKIGAKLYRTDLQGEIVVVSDGRSLSWNVEACETAAAQKDGSETRSDALVFDERAEYILNRNTKKFHRSDCGSASGIKEDNKAIFSGTREELIQAGYSPCGICKP
ncbi:MAG: ComEC/Rec2 family competence protein [Roseburia sp.]